MNFLTSPWFPAAAWLVFTVLSGLVVEAYCMAAHKRVISEVMWWLCANCPFAVFMLGVLCGHFVWQSARTYLRYRSDANSDTPNTP